MSPLHLPLTVDFLERTMSRVEALSLAELQHAQSEIQSTVDNLDHVGQFEHLIMFAEQFTLGAALGPLV